MISLGLSCRKDQVRQFPQRNPRCETDKFDFVLQELRPALVVFCMVDGRSFEHFYEIR